MSVPSRPLRERVIDLEIPENDVARGRALRKTTPIKALAQLFPCQRSATEILVAVERWPVRGLVASAAVLEEEKCPISAVSPTFVK